MFTSIPFNEAIRTALHVYSDASEQAVAAVAYLKVFRTDAEYEFGFVFGKSKLSPRHGHTVPRLELCSAVLASEIATSVTRQLDSPVDATYFYSDSKVVLGYLSNRTRRFYTYVSNRVERILRVSQPAQWNYIPSEKNPADVGTRGIQAKNLADSKWWKPSLHASSPDHDINESYQMVNPDEDAEVRPMITTMKIIETAGSFPSFSTWEKRFSKFSSWERLVHGVTRLREAAVKKTFHISPTTVKEFRATEQLILKIAQESFFEKEIRSLTSGNAIPNDSTLSSLNPYIDEEGVLRVGGRLKRAKFGSNMQNPIIVPKSSHIAVLLVRHHHEKVHHQGRHITAGALRTAGYWIIGAKRLVSSILHHCVTCAKLRGKLQTQIMADLPACRLKPVPPFTYVGVDTFGHIGMLSVEEQAVDMRTVKGGLSCSHASQSVQYISKWWNRCQLPLSLTPCVDSFPFEEKYWSIDLTEEPILLDQQIQRQML